MTLQDTFDRITLEDLRSTGTTKWTLGEGVIGAFIAEMDFPVADVITQRLHREVDQGAFAYLPRDLAAEHRRATAEFVAQRAGWEIAPADVHEMPDVISVYQALIEHFLSPTGRLIIPTPAYMPFLRFARTLGRDIIEVPMLVDDATGAYRNDLAGIEAAFAAGGELLVLCNPHNPSGRVFSREELLAVADVVDRCGGRVFADEIWMPLTLTTGHVSYASLSPVTAGHTITATAGSKAFNLPGLKCAQLITSNDADRERWREVGYTVMHGAANLGLAATATAYAEGGPWLDEVRDYLRGNRERLRELVAEHLPRARLTSMEGTYVAWLDLRAYDGGADGRRSVDVLREDARVVCTDGTACGADWGGFARFIYAMPRPILEEAVRRMGAALEG